MTQLDLRAPARPRVPLVRGLDPGAPAVARPTRRDRSRALSRAGTWALLALLGALLAAGATRWPSFTDDEGTYVAQAWSVLANGELSHYTYWYDHPPLGWIQLAALRLLAGPLLDTGSAVGDARLLMLVPALATLALLRTYARRVGLRPAAAVAAVLLLGLSPLALAFLRSVYLDTLALPWVVAAFVLAASPRGRLWAYAGSGGCFAVALLTKETMLLLLPALALQVWQTCDRRTRAFCVTAFTVVLAGVGLVYPLYALLKGELLPGPDHVSLLAAVAFQLGGRASTGTPLDPDSVSAGLVSTWLALDPWLLGVGVVLVPVALAVRRLRPAAVALALLVLVGLRPGYLPQPYVMSLLPFAALLAAGVADAAVGRVRGLRGSAVVRPALALAACAALLAVVLPQWADGLRTATTEDDTVAQKQTTAYLQRAVPRDSAVLIDDTFYVDLVEAGFRERFGAVWFYKIDRESGLDPSVVRALPEGWRALDYVVLSPVVRSALEAQPDQLGEVREAVENSRVVQVFGAGEGRFEVRQVQPAGAPRGS